MAIEAARILKYRRDFIPRRKTRGLVRRSRFSCRSSCRRARDADHGKNECDCEGHGSNGEFRDSHQRLHSHSTTRHSLRRPSSSRRWMPGASQRFQMTRIRGDTIESNKIEASKKTSHLIFGAAFELFMAPFCRAHSTNPGGALFTPVIVAFLMLAISRH